MGIQFGRWNLDGAPIGKHSLRRPLSIISPYGPNGGGSYVQGDIGILYRHLHTTNEDHQEKEQPSVLGSGIVLTWDGRLDNRADLLSILREKISNNSSDVSIVGEAYKQWGTKCFARLIGDWALSVWNPADRSLVLAKDFAGTRHLYYSVEESKVMWSTILDPLVLCAARCFDLDEEYIAGWLSLFPAAQLTPYTGIQSVPPSSFVSIRVGRILITKYWDFDPKNRIRYRSDQEYEEHFRTLFAQSISRRLRSDKPVLAELSGGMDSSAIVCMADDLIDHGSTQVPRLDTVSYFDDHEPNWNERPYFGKVEDRRGRAGCHISVSSRSPFDEMYEGDQFAATPAFDTQRSDSVEQFRKYLLTQGALVLISGIGGDEALGGVPTPIPELANLLATARFVKLARQFIAWALVTKNPVTHLAGEVVGRFLPIRVFGLSRSKQVAPWLDPAFVQRNARAVWGYEHRLTLLGPLPSFQANLRTLDLLRRQLACIPLPFAPPYERRYPYLDRDLLEFLYGIPREQLVRPGQRRSLMRRALIGIVPEEILNRRRKAFVARGPMASLSTAWPGLVEMGKHMAAASIGIISPKVFVDVLNTIHTGMSVPLGPVMRTLALEYWLRHMSRRGLLNLPVQDFADQSETSMAMSTSC